MLQKILSVLLLALCCWCSPLLVSAAGITNYGPLVTPDYWTAQNKTGEQVLLDAQGVAAFNVKIRAASRSVVDLENYPTGMSGSSLKTKIMDYQILDDDLYLHGNKVSENYKNILRKQTNTAAIPSQVTARYAVVVRRSSLRNLPTGEGLFYYAADTDFDALQETELDPGEPVIVLHQSENKFFYYVQSINYSGWISTYNIAFTDKRSWNDFVKPDDFLVVTDAGLTLKVGSEQVLYQQGARLPLAGKSGGYYTVVVPVRNKDGTLAKQKLTVPESRAVHEGYLPYTANNIIRAAFKFYGMPYGWGGLKNSVDCSSLMYNAYRTVGIILPRNADEQEASAGRKSVFTDAGSEPRSAVINKLLPGAGLYMDGHVVMYIGRINNVPYAIHALGSYFNKNGLQRVMKVVVSDLTLTRGNGNTFIDDLHTAVEFR